jgi:hypothetical protein
MITMITNRNTSQQNSNCELHTVCYMVMRVVGSRGLGGRGGPGGTPVGACPA